MPMQQLLDELAQAQSLSQQLDLLLYKTSAELGDLSAHFQQELDRLENLALAERNSLLVTAQQLAADLQSLQAAVPGVAGVLNQLATDVISLHHGLGSTSAQIRQMAQAFVADLSASDQQARSVLAGLQQDVSNLEARVGGLVAAGTGEIQKLSGEIANEQAAWAQFIQNVIGDLGIARSRLAEHLDQAVSDALGETLRDYGGALSELDERALRDPLGTLREEARQEIEQAILRAFDAGLAGLEDGVRRLGERIAGASDRTDAENQALDEVLQRLKDFAGPLADRIGGVQQIASMVGFRI